jgi:multicomponent Na+:H+ antiporter subunit E
MGQAVNPPVKSSKRNPMLERLVLFGLTFLFWLTLAWPLSPVDGHLMIDSLVAGLIASTVVALVMREIVRVNLIRLVKPVPWFWLLVYVFVFSYYVAKGGLDVLYRVLHPSMPIRPGIVRIRSSLETDTGRTALANSITLTPGTLTMEVTDDGVFYVHWIFVRSEEEEIAAELVLRRFEWFIKRIFE